MKKRVRIYKSPTGEGQFLNKTAQFLRKAQMGGTPSAEELSYPGAGQGQAGQAQQVDDNQLASLVMQDISNSRPKEEIVVKLVNVYGKDPMEATNLVNQIYTYLEEQSEAQKEEDSEESSDEEVTGGDPEDAQEETVMNPVQETEEDFYGDDMNNDMANEVANEDDEIEDDDSDVASQVVMMRGGYMRAQEGAEVESQYPIVFPGIEAYLPANMSDMMSGGYDVATGEAWQRPEFTAPETSQDSGVSYGNMNPDSSPMMDMDDSEPQEENYDESEFRKGGAYKKGKSAYVNSVLKLVKKQMGGDQGNNNPNDLTKKADQSDPIGNNVRRGILDNYIGTLKNQSQIAVAKEQAEQQYDQMMQQQQMMQQGMSQAPMNYSEDDEMLDEAQFGGLFRRRNQEGQERRGLFNREPRVPRIPGGFGQGYPPIESMDVRRSGIFGRPKEYSVNFGQMPSVMPGSGMPGSGPGFYGYGYTGAKKTPARKIVEDNAVYVNSQTNKDVAAVTPGNEATNKDVKVEEKVEVKPDGTTETVATTEVKTPGTETPVTVNSSQTAKEKQVVKDQVKGQKEVNVQKRADGVYSYPSKTAIYKKENNQWYIDTTGTGNSFQKVSSGDVEGRVNALEKNAIPYIQPKAKVKPTVPQVKKDQWGRPVGSKNYGFNPNTGKFEEGSDEKQWNTKKGEQATSFESTYKTNWGTVKPARYQIVRDANGKIIPEKSFAAVEQSQDYGGVIYVPWNELPNRSGKESEESWNDGFGGDMIENKFGGSTFQQGGIVQDPFSDEYGNLQRFVYGGNDDPSLAYIDQSDIDYTGSEDVTDAYFQRGGLFKNLIPANLNTNYRTQYMGARDATGQQIPGYLGQNAQIKNINVQKTGLLSGRPKKYSVTFSNESSDPTKPMISLDGSDEQRVLPGKGPMALSQREMDRGDRQAGRQRPLMAGKRYEKYFEEVPATQEDFDSQANYDTAPKQSNKLNNLLVSPEELMINQQLQKSPWGYKQMPNLESDSQKTGAVPENEGIWKDGDWYESEDAFNKISDKSSKVNQFVSDWAKKWNIPANEARMAFAQEVGVVPDFSNLKDIETYDRIYNQYVTNQKGIKKQYGGGLRKFIPTAQNGVQSPVVYTNNPAMAGTTDVDMLSLNPGIQGLDESSLTSFMNVDNPTRNQSQDPKQYTIDPNQALRQQTQKVYEPEGDVTYDFKTKAGMNNASVQGALLTGNAAAKGALGFIDRMQNRKNEKEMYKNLTADNLYASDPSRDRGDYDTNTGLYRPDQMGQTWNSRSAQMGGQNSYLNEDPDYVEGDEVDMTEEELANFIANGGEVEYL